MKKFLLGLSVGVVTPFVVAKVIEMYEDYQLDKAIESSEKRLAELRRLAESDTEEELEEENCWSPS